MSPTPTNPTDHAASIGPINPITCPEPGCHWACHGVPDKYADSRARILAEHHAAEHTPTPAPAPVAVWSDGEPLMEALAAAVYEQCGTDSVSSVVVDDPRNIAAVAATVARRVLGTPTTNTETPAPAADLPAVLREAADDLTALAAPDSERGAGVRWAADHLRHKADQAQQHTGEAHPAEHTWAAELHDPLADEWIPGRRYVTRARAVNDLEHARKIAPKWKDGAPTERRLVRATTTYTVEQPAPAETEEPTT